MTERLPVFAGDIPMGELARKGAGAIYRGTSVCWARPGETEYEAPVGVPPFFANLLPEGDGFVRLARALGVGGEDLLGMFDRLGGDAPGSIAVGERPAASFRMPLDTPFAEAYARLLGEGRGEAFDAIPGAQPKLSARALTLPAEIVTRPGAFLKFNDDPRYPRLAENEAFFMRIGRRLGHTAAVRLIHDSTGASAVLVPRFDRETVRGRTTKFRMEDGCQLLDLLPSEKYDVTAEDLADAMRGHATAWPVTAFRLFRQLVFRYAIGDSDAHAKNFSLLEKNGVVDVSPMYDALCVRVYGQDGLGLSSLNGESDEPTRVDFLAFADRCEIPRDVAEKVLAIVPWSVRHAIPDLGEIGFDAPTTQRLADLLEYRCRSLDGVDR